MSPYIFQKPSSFLFFNSVLISNCISPSSVSTLPESAGSFQFWEAWASRLEGDKAWALPGCQPHSPRLLMGRGVGGASFIWLHAFEERNQPLKFRGLRNEGPLVPSTKRVSQTQVTDMKENNSKETGLKIGLSTLGPGARGGEQRRRSW